MIHPGAATTTIPGTSRPRRTFGTRVLSGRSPCGALAKHVILARRGIMDMPPKTRAFSDLELLRFVTSHVRGVTSADVESEFSCDREAARVGSRSSTKAMSACVR